MDSLQYNTLKEKAKSIVEKYFGHSFTIIVRLSYNNKNIYFPLITNNNIELDVQMNSLRRLMENRKELSSYYIITQSKFRKFDYIKDMNLSDLNMNISERKDALTIMYFSRDGKDNMIESIPFDNINDKIVWSDPVKTNVQYSKFNVFLEELDDEEAFESMKKRIREQNG